MQNDTKEQFIGIWYAIMAYTLWGILPLYWKLVEHVPSSEVLAHRILWSLFFMMVVLISLKKWGSFLQDLKVILTKRKLLTGIILASILISLNWFTYIYAVNSERIVETSLGYYINPLISVLLGMIVLKEKLSFWQHVSFVLAAIGVVTLTIRFGEFPWIAIVLALTFGLYGLAKKLANLGAMTGLTVETMLITPVTFIYLGYLQFKGVGSFGDHAETTFFLIGAGAVTAIPLLLFASGARRIPLSLIGFLQYIAPTIQLIIGVFVYNEPFTTVHLISFLFIWTALIVFTLGRTKRVKSSSIKRATSNA